MITLTLNHSRTVLKIVQNDSSIKVFARSVFTKSSEVLEAGCRLVNLYDAVHTLITQQYDHGIASEIPFGRYLASKFNRFVLHSSLADSSHLHSSLCIVM